jgi:hypothetical protein
MEDFLGLPINNLEEYVVQHHQRQWETDDMPIKANYVTGEECKDRISIQMAMDYNKKEDVAPYFNSNCVLCSAEETPDCRQPVAGFVSFTEPFDDEIK